MVLTSLEVSALSCTDGNLSDHHKTWMHCVACCIALRLICSLGVFAAAESWGVDAFAHDGRSRESP